LLEAFLERMASQLLVLQGAVAVLVTLLDDGVERLNLDSGIGIAAGRPAGDIKPTIRPTGTRT
jgi:hypothetical protein